jgi:hypothetical protein
MLPRQTRVVECNGIPRARLASAVMSPDRATTHACLGYETDPDVSSGTAGEMTCSVQPNGYT